MRVHIPKKHRNFILALGLFLGWPLLAKAQYYIPFGKKPEAQKQYQAPEEQPKKESFINRYILGRKTIENMEKKKTNPTKIVRADPKTPAELQDSMTLKFVPSPPDPMEAQWLAQDQSLRAKVAPPPLVSKSSDITGTCTESEAQAFKAIKSNFQQVIKDRNSRRTEAKTNEQLNNFMNGKDNRDKIMYLYVKCGSPANA